LNDKKIIVKPKKKKIIQTEQDESHINMNREHMTTNEHQNDLKVESIKNIIQIGRHIDDKLNDESLDVDELSNIKPKKKKNDMQNLTQQNNKPKNDESIIESQHVCESKTEQQEDHTDESYTVKRKKKIIITNNEQQNVEPKNESQTIDELKNEQYENHKDETTIVKRKKKKIILAGTEQNDEPKNEQQENHKDESIKQQNVEPKNESQTIDGSKNERPENHKVESSIAKRKKKKIILTNIEQNNEQINKLQNFREPINEQQNDESKIELQTIKNVESENVKLDELPIIKLKKKKKITTNTEELNIQNANM